jgi:H+-transporting ATPase
MTMSDRIHTGQWKSEPVQIEAISNSDSANELTSQEAKSRLKQIGQNSVPDTALHPLRRVIDKLWAPVPWMLEIAIILQLILHKFTEAGVIATLLVFNAALGFFQEGKAQATLQALKSRLALNASVKRDGTWRIIPSAEVVPGDLVKLSLGAVVPADVSIKAGSIDAHRRICPRRVRCWQ